MRHALWACIALLLCARAGAGQPNWILLQDENFRVYSSASERATREMLRQFELIRGFFNQVTAAKPAKAEPVCVMIFGSEKEYQGYRLNSYATAYYAKRSDGDYIVVGRLGEGSIETVSHEYTHLAFAHDGYSLPPWLNEGIAELFSTLHPDGEFTLYGAVLPGRLQEMDSEPWVPLQAILAADQKSAYYNEASKAGSLYDEGWALVHMLATTDEYRARFWDVVKAVNAGVDSVAALEKVYGMPLAKLEDTLQWYVRGNRFNQLKIKIALRNTEQLTIQPADPFEVREVQAALLSDLPGRKEEARARLEELVREDGKRPGPWAKLGYLAWRDGQEDQAVEDFGKAFEAGDRHPRMLLDYAHLSQSSNRDHSIAALQALLEAEPANADARQFLAGLQMSEGQYADALATVRPIVFVKSPEQRDSLLYMRAFAYLQLNDYASACWNADHLARESTADNMRTQADYVLRKCRTGADSGSKAKATRPAAAAHSQ